MGDSEDDDDDESGPAVSMAAHLAALGAGAASDSEDEEEEAPPAEEKALKPDKAAAPKPAGEAEPEGLPNALDALEGSAQEAAFLQVEGPDFDASRDFKPPPVTGADFLPAVSDSARHVPRQFAESSETQRHHREFQYGEHGSGRASGKTRLSGSVCFETDDERGRRVVYGAHQMLKADPWSDCNPNFKMGHGPHGNKRRKK